jgi:hypothetical protein
VRRLSFAGGCSAFLTAETTKFRQIPPRRSTFDQLIAQPACNASPYNRHYTKKERYMDAVAASGPVSFTDKDGIQHVIPISELYFDATGIHARGTLKDDETLKVWLARLSKGSRLRRSSSRPTGPALVLAAKTAGLAGNGIAVKVANVRDSGGSKVFDLSVTESEHYVKLTAATAVALSSALIDITAGTPAAPLPGVYLPVPGTPVKVPQKTWKAGDPESTAFELKAKGDLADKAITTVTIGSLDANDKFDLDAVRTKEAKGLEPAGVQAAFGYAIAVTIPAGGLAAPAEGTFRLAGGAAPQGAVAAKVTLPGNP